MRLPLPLRAGSRLGSRSRIIPRLSSGHHRHTSRSPTTDGALGPTRAIAWSEGKSSTAIISSGFSYSASAVHSRPYMTALTSIPLTRRSTTYPPADRRNIHSSPQARAPEASPFKLHDIGEGITEVEVIRWYVSEGQEVQEFDALCEVQSDKSVVELTSHAAGTVKNIQFGAGEMVKVGQVLCEIHTAEGEGEGEATLETEGGEGAASPNSAHGQREDAVRSDQPDGASPAVASAEQLSETLERAEEVTSNPQRTQRTISDAPIDQSSGEGKTRRHPLAEHNEAHSSTVPCSETDAQADTASDSSFSRADELPPASLFSGEAAILPTPPRPAHITHGPVPSRTPREEGERTVVRASPAVRTLAARLGVDLALVQGKGGRLTKDDVQAFAEGTDLTQVSKAVGARGETPEYTRVDFGRTRKVMYRALGGQGNVPHFGYSHTLDLTALLPYLKASKAPESRASEGKRPYQASDMPLNLARDPLQRDLDFDAGRKMGLLTFLVKGLILAMDEHPIMRSRVKEGQGESQEKWMEVARDGVVGVAVSDPKHGLLTPSLPPLPPSTSLSSITTHLAALRKSPTKPSSQSANLVISSVGGLGESTGAMPIIPPGGLAICAVGRATWEMEWCLRNGQGEGADGAGRGKSVWELDERTVREGGLRAVLRVPVGWSGDHRVLEGAELIAFTESWKKYVEQPWTWLKLE